MFYFNGFLGGWEDIFPTGWYGYQNIEMLSDPLLDYYLSFQFNVLYEFSFPDGGL